MCPEANAPRGQVVRKSRLSVVFAFFIRFKVRNSVQRRFNRVTCTGLAVKAVCRQGRLPDCL